LIQVNQLLARRFAAAGVDAGRRSDHAIDSNGLGLSSFRTDQHGSSTRYAVSEGPIRQARAKSLASTELSSLDGRFGSI
jgi:hypothetical protein